MSNNGRSTLFGLLGDPVSHSLSPFIMNRAFDALNLDAVYVAFGVEPRLLSPSLAGLVSLGVDGLNVTFPYKEEVLYHVHAISAEVEVIQAVNTVAVYEGEMNGFNTDAQGTAIALETFTDTQMESARVFIFGAGGSARAAAYGLLERGVERITFGTRSLERGEMAIDRFQYAFPEQTVDFVVLGGAGGVAARRDAIRRANIVINATPVGMEGRPEDALVEDPAWIQPGQTFFDFVYHHGRTAFLETARRGGATTLGGMALLVAQASESFRIWTDQGFDVKEMAEAVELFSRPEAPEGGRSH